MTCTQNGIEFLLREDGTAAILRYTGSASGLTIPEMVRGHKVTRVEAEAFRDCHTLSYIKIPGSIVSIGPDAFKNCGMREDEELSRAACAHSRRDLEYMFGYGYEAVESRLIEYQLGLSDGYLHVAVTVVKGSYAEDYCRKNHIRIVGFW